MIGAAIGAAGGLFGSLFGGIKAAKQRRAMRRDLERQDDENTMWYNANALGDYTQRADAQNLIRNLRENLDRQNRRVAGSAVITGATPEQQAAQQERSNNVISDTYANLGAMGQQYKDRVTDKYLARRDNIANQRMDMMNSQANSYENLMSSGLNTLAGSAGSMLDSLDTKFGWTANLGKGAAQAATA